MAVIAAGVLLRVLHLATSVGSPDTVTWTRNVINTERFGILGAYLHDPGLNHPPLALAIARLLSEAGALLGVQFQDMFRLLQTLADVVTTLALVRLATLHAATLFMLSPAAIFITGFHCQSDPLMTMFLVLAIASRRPLVAGAMIGLAAGIKIIALVALPLILLRYRGRELAHYLAAAAGVLALVFVPAVAATGSVVLRNVFGYTGLTVSWGLNYVLRLSPFARQMMTYALLALLALLWLRELRRRSDDRLRTARAVGIALLLVLVLAPGFGVQYLFWPLPFLALLLRRYEALLLHGVLSAFLFAMYTAWSGGWPWWFGVHSAGIAGVQWAVVVWIALVIALGISVKRAG
ncbi:MAG TPA: glycosyltransferase 87 family protein [Thermoanaerobaculia bacterium]|nr:glycosyltransferase 87 family protein [Thermoanaerobaculia bacterium]